MTTRSIPLPPEGVSHEDFIAIVASHFLAKRSLRIIVGDAVETIHEVFRPLDMPGGNIWRKLHNHATHSALGLKLASKRFVIVEWSNDSKVHIVFDAGFDVDASRFYAQGFRWWAKEKQINGYPPPYPMSVRYVKNTMEHKMRKGDYDLFKHCCHNAQERTRKRFRILSHASDKNSFSQFEQTKKNSKEILALKAAISILQNSFDPTIQHLFH